jgi:ABC-type cobalamin/Fe3+-siderophores transport system ATPase subunit
MKIKKIRLQRFRQFEDTTFNVGPFNILVGANNCGKTSVLHAIRAFFLLMHGHVRFEGEPPMAVYHRRFISDAGEIAPTPDIRELWYRQEAGRKLSFSVTFDDDVTFTVVVRQQFGQIHVSADDLPEGLTSAQAASYLGTTVAFIPGLVGVLVTEPYATGARRNALATQGRYSEIFRSSLQQLKESAPDLVAKINEWLEGLFSVTVRTIEFDPRVDEFVTVKYSENRIEFDVVSSGAGLQQVIQMLAYVYLSRPRILLIDEPDAHLHSKLQARLGELFRRVASDLDAQVFLSTHSLDLIDTFSTNEVLVVDATQEEVFPIGANNDLVSALVDANVVDVSALSRLLSSRKLVIVEDEDLTILKAMDRAVGGQLFSASSRSYVLPAKGAGNFRAMADLGRILGRLTGTEFELAFIEDRDGMPDFICEGFLDSQGAEGVRALVLNRHEIENYLLEPELLLKAGELRGREIRQETVQSAILSSAQELKARARIQSVETARLVNRHLATERKFEDTDLQERTHAWFDGLDLTDVAQIQRVFPGKELLQSVLKKLNEGQPHAHIITRGHLVASLTPELVASDIRELLASVGSASANLRLTPG